MVVRIRRWAPWAVFKYTKDAILCFTFKIKAQEGTFMRFEEKL